jgi:hypothetical protein
VAPPTVPAAVGTLVRERFSMIRLSALGVAEFSVESCNEIPTGVFTILLSMRVRDETVTAFVPVFIPNWIPTEQFVIEIPL